jgi:hypothetical protein
MNVNEELRKHLEERIRVLEQRLREVEEERDDARERATFNARLADQRFREGAEIRSLLALAVADAEGPWDFAWVPAAKAALSTERTPTMSGQELIPRLCRRCVEGGLIKAERTL